MPIHGLPNELLLSVFSELHAVRQPQTREILDGECNLDALFPYAISAVCRRWRDVASLKSVFWTRIFAIIDHPMAIKSVQAQLAWSCGREIEFILMRHPTIYNRSDIDSNTFEAEKFFPLFRLVMANLSRCRSIAIKLLFTATLPSLSIDFHGPAPVLTSLILQAKIHSFCNRDYMTMYNTSDHSDVSTPNLDHAHQTTPPWLASRNLTPFSTPNLNHIDINGRNFANACLYIPTWLASWNSQDNIYLRLSTFKPVDMCPVDNRFTSNDFIECLRSIPHLNHLILCDVDFRPGETDAPTCELLEMTELSWIGLSADFFESLCVSLEFPDLALAFITKCKITGIMPPSGCDLIIDDYEADSETLREFLEEWDGVGLAVKNCPGVDDAFLGTLWDVTDYPGSCTLSFSGCVNFTSEGLIRLVDRITSSGKPLDQVMVDGHPETLSPDKMALLGEVCYKELEGFWNDALILGRRKFPAVDLS
ncbi:hypothetical protein H0H92_001304 [Tricholoma furcatifolium]|nr:hypothetical protein H0H92_001304 [Tricholoma furcatifolium]